MITWLGEVICMIRWMEKSTSSHKYPMVLWLLRLQQERLFILQWLTMLLFSSRMSLKNSQDPVANGFTGKAMIKRFQVLAMLLLSLSMKSALPVDREWRRYWAARMDDPLSDAETLKLADGDRVAELGKKPQSYNDIQGQYIGLIKIRADHVARLPEAYHVMDRDTIYDGKDFENMYMTSFIQCVIDSGWETRAAFIDNGWAEVDCEADLAVALKFCRL
jgi:hypothetical protein